MFSKAYLQGHLKLDVIYPLPNKPWFLRVCSPSVLKTLWKKKLLVTSNFSFSRSVFYSIISRFVKIFFDFLPQSRNIDWTKLKACGANEPNFAIMVSLFDKKEITVGNGENAGYQHFLLFTQCFLKNSSLGSLKARIVLQRV